MLSEAKHLGFIVLELPDDNRTPEILRFAQNDNRALI